MKCAAIVVRISIYPLRVVGEDILPDHLLVRCHFEEPSAHGLENQCVAVWQALEVSGKSGEEEMVRVVNPNRAIVSGVYFENVATPAVGEIFLG